MKTSEELKTIAKDLYAEKIFSDRHLRNPKNELSMVFMVMMFMEKEDIKEFKKREPAFIFEYLDKAMPGAVNGYPIFLSMQSLNQKEFDEMLRYYEKIKSSVSSALKDG